MRAKRWLWFILAGVVVGGLGSGCFGLQLPVVRPPSSSEEWEVLRCADPGPGHDTGSYCDLDFVDSATGWAPPIGDAGTGMLHTRDGGRAWSAQPLQAVQVDFVDAQAGWAVNSTRSKLYHTQDGGATWSTVASRPRHGILDLAALSRDEVWCIGEDGVFHTVDGGSAWSQAVLPTSPGMALGLGALFFLDRQHGWLLGWQADGKPHDFLLVFVTEDGGKSFQMVRTPFVEMGPEGPNHLFFVNEQEGWAAVGGPSLLHSRDGGKSWVVVTPEADGTPIAARYRDCYFLTPEVGWAVGSADRHALAITTRDGGRTWRRSRTGGEGVRDSELEQVVFVDPEHAWVTGSAGIPRVDRNSVAFILGYRARGGS